MLSRTISRCLLAASFAVFPSITTAARAAEPAPPKAAAGASVERRASPEQQRYEQGVAAANKRAKLQEISRLESEVGNLASQAKLLAKVERDLRTAIQNTCGLSPENVATTIIELEKEKFNLGIEVEVGSEVESTLRSFVEQSAGEAAKRNDSDLVLKNLTANAELKQAQLERVKKLVAEKTVSEEDVETRESDLRAAQIQVELRKEELAKTAKPAGSQYSQRLADLVLKQQEDEARLKILGEKLANLEAVHDQVDKYNEIKDVELAELSKQLELLKERIRQNQLELW